MTQALVSINNLSISFAQHQAVEQLSFSINSGEMLALVGESGSGKSLSALAIMGLLPDSAKTTGEIIYQDQNLLSVKPDKLREIRGKKIAMAFQEPISALNPLHCIGKQIAENLVLKNDKLKTRVLELLKLVELNNPEQRLKSYPHELSGGERQRVMLAIALAQEPKILLADEPTSALDAHIQQQILNLIKSLQKKLGMSVLLITHDLNLVADYADSILVMRSGKFVEQNNCQDLFSNPQTEYTKELLSTKVKGQPIKLPTKKETLLEAKNINLSFCIKNSFFKSQRAYKKAIQDVSLQIRQGETLAVVGESGSGKSSLGLALLRLISTEGEIYWRKQALHKLSRAALRPIRSDLQLVLQDPFSSLNPRFSIAEAIAEGLGNIDNSEKDRRVIQAMQDVGLDPASRHRYPQEFSGGQKQRICIARALILQPKLIVLDEPTSALDRPVQAQIIELLKKLQEKYQLSYLFISHDLALVKAISHTILVLKQGQVIEQGSTRDVLRQPKHSYTKLLLKAAAIKD